MATFNEGGVLTGAEVVQAVRKSSADKTITNRLVGATVLEISIGGYP